MLKKFFKKKYTIDTFKELLQSKPPNLKEIKRALDNDIDINYVNEKEESFLHYTVKRGLTTCAKFLIDSGIKVDTKDKDDNTPIYLAVSKTNRIVVQALLDTKRINVNQLKDSRTLLQDAILQGGKEIVDILLKTSINKAHIDNKGRNILFDAIGNGNDRIIDTVLAVDGLNLNVIDIEDKAVLHQKNVLDDDKLAIKLIKMGADPTVLDGNEKSYLLYIALRGDDIDEDIIDAAIEAGFNINSHVRDKNSILMEIMFAFSKLSDAETERRDKLMATASKLVRKGLDVSAKNNKGETALFDAVRKVDIHACAFLLGENIEVNAENNDGNTVLSEAVSFGVKALDMILLLLRNGANVKHSNKYQQSVIEILNELVLYSHGNIDFIYMYSENIDENGQYMRVLKEVLEMSSYDVNTISSEGEPLFFKSLLFGNRPLFTLYCNYGVNINALNIRGNSIFSRYVGKMASQETLPKDYREIIIMLLDKRVDINKQDQDGKTILSKLIVSDNMPAFRILFSVSKFNFMLQDNRGFTLIHDCISTSNITIIKLIDQLEPKLKNIPDNIGLLPIAYAAIFGNLKLVLTFMNLGSNFTSNKVLSSGAKKKFAPLLKNLDKLQSEDANELHKLNILKEQILRDFG